MNLPVRLFLSAFFVIMAGPVWAGEWTYHDPVDGKGPTVSIDEKDASALMTCDGLLPNLLITPPADHWPAEGATNVMVDVLVDDKPVLYAVGLDAEVERGQPVRILASRELVDLIQSGRNWVNFTIHTAQGKQLAEVMFDAEGTMFSMMAFSASCQRKAG